MKSPAAVATARAVGQASAVAHMGAHALGAAAYAAKAVSLAAADQVAARRDEVRWQIDHMTPEVRAALSSEPAPARGELIWAVGYRASGIGSARRVDSRDPGRTVPRGRHRLTRFRTLNLDLQEAWQPK